MCAVPCVHSTQAVLYRILLSVAVALYMHTVYMFETLALSLLSEAQIMCPHLFTRPLVAAAWLRLALAWRRLLAAAAVISCLPPL